MGREGVDHGGLSGRRPPGQDRMARGTSFGGARVTSFGGARVPKVLVVLLALMVVACTAPSERSGTSRESINCAKLASLGGRTCPPAHPALAKPQLTNDTHGQVSNKEFPTLVSAFLRTDAYETYARAANEPALLQAGILSTRHAAHLTFGGDLQQLSQAASEGGHFGGYGPALTSLRLVVLPVTIKQEISECGYQSTRLGWIVTYSAPVSAYIISGSRFNVLLSAFRTRKAG